MSSVLVTCGFLAQEKTGFACFCHRFPLARFGANSDHLRATTRRRRIPLRAERGLKTLEPKAGCKLPEQRRPRRHAGPSMSSVSFSDASAREEPPRRRVQRTLSTVERDALQSVLDVVEREAKRADVFLVRRRGVARALGFESVEDDATRSNFGVFVQDVV